MLRKRIAQPGFFPHNLAPVCQASGGFHVLSYAHTVLSLNIAANRLLGGLVFDPIKFQLIALYTTFVLIRLDVPDHKTASLDLHAQGTYE